MSNAAALPLSQSLKRFWPHLVPVLLFPSFATVLLSRKQDFWAISLAGVAFFASSSYAFWPTFKGRAQFSFWHLACAMHFVGALLAIPVSIGFGNLFGAPS